MKKLVLNLGLPLIALAILSMAVVTVTVAQTTNPPSIRNLGTPTQPASFNVQSDTNNALLWPLPLMGVTANAPVLTRAPVTLSAGQSGSLVWNQGAGAACTNTLPPAVIIGLRFKALVASAHPFAFKANSSDVINLLDGSQTGTGGYIANTNGTVGESIDFLCTSTNNWTVIGTSPSSGSHWSF